MLEIHLLTLEITFLLIATLYSITGHAGASGYIAVMALLGFAPSEIKPLALMLNLVVSAVASVQFYRAGHFDKKLFLPFVLSAMPCAFIGGYVQLPVQAFKVLLGLALLFAAGRIFLPQPIPAVRLPSLKIALPLGGLMGLLSGLIGVGGGIFFTPLLLLKGWANAKQAAAVSAPFILLNSLAALLGLGLHGSLSVTSSTLCLALFVLLGGLLGASLGSRRLPSLTISRVLSVVLLIAGGKLLYV